MFGVVVTNCWPFLRTQFFFGTLEDDLCLRCFLLVTPEKKGVRQDVRKKERA